VNTGRACHSGGVTRADRTGIEPTDRSHDMHVINEALTRARMRSVPEVRYRTRPARVVAAEAAARRARRFCG
jgi:hypothetical protein